MVSEADMLKLIHELEVHRIELEMQNEELTVAKEKADLAEKRYTELYDFAPSGYFTLSRLGNILEMNLRGAQMLGKVRPLLINSQFKFFVNEESRSIFITFLEEIFQGKNYAFCDVSLGCKDNESMYAHLTGIVSENKEHCHITAVDITDRKKTEVELLKAKEKSERNESELNKVQAITLVGSWYLNVETNEVVWTEELYKMYGFDPAFPPPPYTEHMKLFTTESWEILSASLAKTSETGIPYELELKTIRKDKSNGWMWVRGNAIFDNSNKIIGLWGAAQDITERKHNEEQLRQAKEKAEESEVRFRNLMESIEAVAVQGYGPDGITQFWNKASENLYGYTQQEAIGTNILDLIVLSEMKDVVASAIREMAESGEPIPSGELFMKHKDGSPVPVISHHTIVKVPGHAQELFCLDVDISKRKILETELKESEERFELAMKASNDGLFDWNLETNEIYYSPGWKKMLGFEDHELPNDFSVWEKTTEPEDAKKSWELQQKLITKQIDRFVMEFKMKHKDGHWVDILSRAEAFYNDSGKAVRIVGTHTDISERKLAEEEIKKTARHYQALIEKAPDGIVLIDAGGSFKYISPAAKKMFGYSQTEVVSGNPTEYTHPDDLQRVLSELGKIFEDPTYVPALEYRFIDKAGYWHWVETTFSNLLAYPGVESIVLNFREITERKLLEDTQAFLLQISNPGSDENFFESLAKYLSQCLDMEYVCIDLLEGDGLTAKTLAIYNEGNFDPNVSYTLKDTPCGEVVGNHVCCYPNAVRSLFPNDAALEDIKAESYIGTTLRNFDGKPIGLIAVIGQKPMHNNELATSILKLVSLRAAGQLEAILAEEKVRESEEKFRVLIESTSVGIYLTDLNGKCTYVNPKWCEMAQLSYNQALGDGWVNGIYEEDRENVFSSWLNMVASDGNWNFEYRFGTPDKISWVFGTAKSYKNDSGQIVGFIGSNVDITERKNAENEVIKAKLRAEESEEFFRSIFENSPVGKSITGVDGSLKTNKAFSDMLGYSFEEFQTKNFEDITHPDDLQKTLEAVDPLLKGKESVIHFEKRFIHKNGSNVYSEVVSNLQKSRDGKPLFFITSVNDITERKQNLEKLIKSEERFALVIEASEQGIWDWNVETNEVFYSEQWKKQIGYKDDELKNEFDTWVEHLHPDEREYCQNAVLSYLKQPVEQFILDFRFRHKDGTYRWIHNKAASLKNNEGKVIRLFGTHSDFTETKLSESIFKEIIEKNPMSVQILDMEGYPIQVNPAHTKLFGVDLPSGYSVLKDPQLLALGFGKLFERIKKGEVVYFPDSYYNVHDVDPSFPDSPLWVKALGFTLNDIEGNPDKIVLMHENITERKNAEALLNDIIENNPLSIQVVDKGGHTISGNSAFIELFGIVPPPEFSIFDDLKSKSTELGNLVSRVQNGEIVHLPDLYFNAHDAIAEAPDIPLWIRALIFPLNDSIGRPERFVIMHENISGRKIAEQELIKAKEQAEESDRLKSAFLANMSHEIRTPMNGILGFSELLKEPGLTGDQQQQYIRIIEKSGARMLSIINDIVDISKIEAGLMNIHIQETDINEKIDFIYSFFKLQVEEKGMQLLCKKSLPAKEAMVRTDNEKFYSILTNLVKNAIKFSEEGTIEFGYERKGNDIEFFVKDTGIGIPKERQEAIFERFIQADISDKMARQGAGLGLSISKAYVEMLGGRIWVESEEGIGTTFYFTLPYKTESEEKTVVGKTVPAHNEKNLDNPEVAGLKILIAEDDETSELLISISVREFSREIIKVKTGNEAVEICRNNPDIDLIMMDIQMPGMNGYEATHQIRQFNKVVVIIAQTAFGLSGDREKAIEAGCNDYISKPVSKDEIVSLIHKYFRKKER